jgi:hypothetical protein
MRMICVMVMGEERRSELNVLAPIFIHQSVSQSVSLPSVCDTTDTDYHLVKTLDIQLLAKISYFLFEIRTIFVYGQRG